MASERDYFTKEEEKRLIRLYAAMEAIDKEIGAIQRPVLTNVKGDREEWSAAYIKPLRTKGIALVGHFW